MRVSSLVVAAIGGAAGWAEGLNVTCDEATIATACRAWSEHQKELCHKLENVKCCLQSGAPQGNCCGAADAQIKMLPLCRSSLAARDRFQCTTEIEASCASCNGDGDCSFCREEEEVKCCLKQGGSTDLCCPAHSAEAREGSVCHPILLGSYGASPCEPEVVEAECLGCTGEAACKLCREEEAVKCCKRKGGTTEACCKEGSEAIKADPICASSSAFEGEGDPTPEAAPCTAAAVEATCHDRGEEAQRCRDEEYLKCCLAGPSGSKEACCPLAPAEVRAEPLCQSSVEILP